MVPSGGGPLSAKVLAALPFHVYYREGALLPFLPRNNDNNQNIRHRQATQNQSVGLRSLTKLSPIPCTTNTRCFGGFPSRGTSSFVAGTPPHPPGCRINRHQTANRALRCGVVRCRAVRRWRRWKRKGGIVGLSAGSFCMMTYESARSVRRCIKAGAVGWST